MLLRSPKGIREKDGYKTCRYFNITIFHKLYGSLWILALVIITMSFTGYLYQDAVPSWQSYSKVRHKYTQIKSGCYRGLNDSSSNAKSSTAKDVTSTAQVYENVILNYEEIVPPKQVVLLLTSFRSGSTFLGELFNQNPDAHYQFEPLLPFSEHCEVLAREKVDFLSRIMKCNYTRVMESYREAFNQTQSTDKYAQCIPNNMCFYWKNSGLVKRYQKLCVERYESLERSNRTRIETANECQRPFKISLLSTLCQNAEIVVYKVIRICSIDSISQIIEDLSTDGIDIRIVHLVRDPRGVISSIRSFFKDQNEFIRNSKRFIVNLCERYRRNLKFYESKILGKSNEMWKRRYIRIRYEDLAENLSKTATKVYRFLSRQLPKDVINWIKETQPNITKITLQLEREEELIKKGKINKTTFNKLKSIIMKSRRPLSTVRDPREFKTKWRRSLPQQIVLNVQTACSDVMSKLGYQTFSNEAEIKNFTLPFYLIEPNTN